MGAYERLIEGYKIFRREYTGRQHSAYRDWAAKGQNPKVLMIGCSDSRVNPAIVTQAGLGELFVVNNVANIVPPYKEGEGTHHSTSAAIEYAVNHLNIEHIIIMGHSGCGGVKALMTKEENAANDGPYSFLSHWIEIISPAKERVLKDFPDTDIDGQCHACEKEAILVSLNNLAGFPWVKKRIQEGTLHIHGWHFSVADALLQVYEVDSGIFTTIKR